MDTTQLKTKVIYEYTKKNNAKNILRKYSGRIVDSGKSLQKLHKNQGRHITQAQNTLFISKKTLYGEFVIKSLQSIQRVSEILKIHKKYEGLCYKYYKQRFPKQIINNWRKLAHNQTRNAILQQVNRKTDSEIMQMQKEYEQRIGQIENVLEKKLIELKVEKEQHKELVLRYDGIVEKRTTIKH